jgi:hypothetical protein
MSEWKQVFDEMNQHTSQTAVKILNEKGILTDEDLGFMTKVAYKKGQEEFVNHMKNNGATSEYAFTCVFIPTNGEVCAIFDTEKFDLMSARNYIEQNYSVE